MDERTFISRLLAYIDDGAEADNLTESALRDDAPELYRAGLALFGSWDAALASALVFLREFYEKVEARERREEGEADVIDVDRPERTVGPAASWELYALATSGVMMRLDAERLPTTARPELRELGDGPGAEHRLERLFRGADDSAAVLVSNRGNGVSVDHRLLASWERDAAPRQPSLQFSGLERDEVFAAAMPRRAVRDAERIYSVSLGGQLKATDAKEYRRLSTEAMVALLLRDDDVLVSVFAGETDASVCVASSHGKALVFDASTVRSQGRRATGVRAIALDPDATVVGAFVVEPGAHMVLATESGLLKRTPMSAFRPQGRAGGGLQTCRLANDDHVAAVGSVDPAGDVVLVTDRGRYTRFPAFDVPFGDRAARGEAMVALEDGEQIVQVIGLPAGSMDEA